MLKKGCTAIVLIQGAKAVNSRVIKHQTLLVENKLVQSFCRGICQYVNMYNTL